jgi:tetratricopeptide (TPR) repeat protein
VSTDRLFGILALSFCLHGQNLPSPSRAAPEPFSSPLLTAAGDSPIAGQFPAFSHASQPISGVVSLSELEHPIPGKAARLAYEAQQLVRANKISKAVAKLEKAIRIYPRYRDARVNLGVQYASLGRVADARSQFEKALEVGPPAAQIYVDLALTSLYAKHYQEAMEEAQKALDLDKTDGTARRVLQWASNH